MLAVGTLLYGYCGGFFGRNSYDTKRIEAFGADWIVVRSIKVGINAIPEFAFFENSAQMISYVADWSSEKTKEDWNN